MYTDTNSLIYHIECDDVYEIMKRDISRFDTSDYTVDNVYGIPFANKKYWARWKMKTIVRLNSSGLEQKCTPYGAARLCAIRDSCSKLAIFYSYKICK